MLQHLLLAVLPAAFPLQGEVAASARLLPAAPAPGAAAELRLRLELAPGWHVYSPEQDPSLGLPVSVSRLGPALKAVGELRALDEAELHLESVGGETLAYEWLSGAPELSLPVKVTTEQGVHSVPLALRVQACTERVCLPPREILLQVDFGTSPAPAAPAMGGLEALGLPEAPQARPAPVAAWRAEVVPAEVRAGERAELRLYAEVQPGWHLYHPDMDRSLGIPVNVKGMAGALAAVPGARLRALQEPVAHVEQIGGEDLTYLWLQDRMEFRMPVSVTGRPGAVTGRVEVQWQACNDKVCDPPRVSVAEVTLRVLPGGAAAGPTGDAGGSGQGFLAFLLAAALAGLGTLLTPCVFPMIPITVSFFTKRAEAGRGSALGNATAYGLGILFTFVGLGLGLAAVLGASGANEFASNPWVNLMLAGLFLLLGFSLLGFYDIRAPRWLQRKTAAGPGSLRGGYLPVLLMAVAFTVTAFTCTVGFVGFVLVLAAKSGQWSWAAAGMTVYAAAFALPFFLLALFPAWLARLPQAGGWMNFVKASMGFIEIFFAWKFLSNADMAWDWQLLTRPVYVVFTAVPLLFWAAYLFGVFRLPHDSHRSRPGAGRALTGALVLGFALYVGGGLLERSRPFVGALEAYFPPPQYGVPHTGAGSLVPGPAGLYWYESYQEAYQSALDQGKPLFVDFTGVTCVNCRRMEGNIMPHDSVRPLLERFVRAELWVDKGEYAEWNKNHQIERYDTAQQPLYVILDPRSDLDLGLYDGYAPDPEAFAAFLRSGLDQYRNAAGAAGAGR